MKKKIILGVLVLILIIAGIVFLKLPKEELKYEYEQVTGTIISKGNNEITIQDSNDTIYTFSKNVEAEIGDSILVKYTVLLGENNSKEIVEVTDYEIVAVHSNVPSEYNDNGIFKDYYEQAYEKLESMTLDEKIGQLLLVRYSSSSKQDLTKYNFAGYVFYQVDFNGKNKQSVINMINEVQNKANIPLLTSVDEEGGSVIRVSSNSNLASSPFKSPQKLYAAGGFDLIKQDTVDKSKLLYSLGLNLNLAPVVDIADKGNYIYSRTLGQNAELTATYAKTVIEASKGTGVSYTLKHFPGYGNNGDTHSSPSIDTSEYDKIMNEDVLPFKTGIENGAEAVMVSHNIVKAIDSSNPSSLSRSIHNILRDDLKFTGVIITDDISMGAVTNISNSTLKAVLAGNDLIITSDYKKSINEIKTALDNGTLDEELINRAAFRVLAWKYYKGLMANEYK